MGIELIAALLVIAALAGLLARALLKLRRLEAPLQCPRARERAGWGNLPQAWMPALTELTISAHDIFWETDRHHAFVQFFRRDKAVKGFDLSDLGGKAPWNIPSTGVSATQWEALRASMEAHEPFHNFVVGRTDGAGRLYFGSVSGAPVFDRSGGFIGYRGAVRDVTLMRHAQVQLQIQSDITRILAGSARLSDALPGLIEAVCRPLEWSFGARWMLA